jgi:hypothetical protein
MLYRSLIVCAISALIQIPTTVPAYAGLWLCYPPGATRTGDIEMGSEPCKHPDGYTTVEWNIENGDQDPHNYLLQDGKATHSPAPPLQADPAAASAPLPPDAAGFISAIRTEPAFDASLRMDIATGMLALLQMDVDKPALLQQDWSDAKAKWGNTWLTPDVQKKLEGYAATYRIPLLAPKGN